MSDPGKSQTTYFIVTPEGSSSEPLSRKDIKAMLKDGRLRKSRLVWSSKSESWKPAQDMDGLKGTRTVEPSPVQPAPTGEKNETCFIVATPTRDSYENLPRSEIRKMLKDGRLRESRLVWDQKGNQWNPVAATPSLKHTRQVAEKPVAQAPLPPVVDEKKETIMLVATKTRESYSSLPRSEVVKNLKDGKLTESQLVWDPKESSWKTVRETPGLVHPNNPPAQASTPVAAKPVARIPVVPSTQASGVRPVPVAGGAAVNTRSSGVRAGISQVRPVSPLPANPSTQASGERPAVNTRLSSATLSKKEIQKNIAAISPSDPGKDLDRKWRNYKIAQVFYGVLIVGLVLFAMFYNSVGVDEPVQNALNRSEFRGSVVLKGHYGNYFDPRAIVIDFKQLPAGMPSDKFVELLTQLAIGTRGKTMASSVELQKDGVLLYVIPAQAWRDLADQAAMPVIRRVDKIVYNLYGPDGKVVYSEKKDKMSVLMAEKKKVFDAFITGFVGVASSSPPVGESKPPEAPPTPPAEPTKNSLPPSSEAPADNNE